MYALNYFNVVTPQVHQITTIVIATIWFILKKPVSGRTEAREDLKSC
jgi:hypothetical protein